MSEFNFNDYAKEVSLTGAKFKIGYFNLVVLLIFIIFLLGSDLIFSFDENSQLSSGTENSIAFAMITFILLGIPAIIFYWYKDKHIFGFYDNCLTSDYLVKPYPFKNIKRYVVLNTKGGIQLLLYIDPTKPPIVKKTLFFRYNAVKGVITISMPNIVSNKGHSISNEQIVKLLRRQLRSAGVIE